MDFLQPDYWAHIPDKFMRELQEREARGSEEDKAILRDVYESEVRRDYLESSLIDREQAEGLRIFDDGNAETSDGHRILEGAPSWGKFIEYVREGR